MSNFPPGVTGNEYEIAGPDAEGEEERWCHTCERETTWLWQRYRQEWWAECEVCNDQTEGVVGEEDWGA